MTMPVTALSSRAFCVLSEPRMTGSASRPPMSAPIASGPDMSITSLPGQPPQGVGRAGVAQLREQRRVHQLGDQRAAAHRREARLRAADDRAVAGRDRAQRRLVAVDDRRDADVDRLRREHQPGAAEAADLEVERGRCGCPSTHNRAGRSPSRDRSRLGQNEVEHFERHAPGPGRGLRAREPLRPETVAVPPAKLRLVGASAQPSPERVSTAAWLSTSGWRSIRPLPVSRIASGETSASGREGEGGAAPAGEGGADLARCR